MFKLSLLRDLEAQSLVDSFLISAVASILLIRGYLQLTGYPQIGTGGLHIAHMLWGGLFMLIATTSALIFLNREKYWIVAILGGVGFGTFIDELGKFITKDNNYLFEPTVSIIYVIFILIYLILKFIENYIKPSQEEYLANTAEVIKEALVSPISSEKFSKAVNFLSNLDQSNPHSQLLKNLLEELRPQIKDQFNLFSAIKNRVALFYDKLIQQKFFIALVIFFFIGQAAYTIFHSIITTEIIADYIFPNQSTEQTISGSIDELGEVIFSLISGVLIIVGIIVLFKSKLKAYHFFKLAILINIFLTSIFNFYNNQFEALYGFFFNILVLITLNFIIQQEEFSFG